MEVQNVSHVSPEHDLLSTRRSSFNPAPGDLIRIYRKLYGILWYYHWGLYLGQNKIVHVRGGILEEAGFRPKVVIEELDRVRNGDPAHVDNQHDFATKAGRKTLPKEHVLKAALAVVGKEFDYCVFSNNCEHFVTGSLYGAPGWSQQVQVVDTLKSSVAVLTRPIFALHGTLSSLVVFSNISTKLGRVSATTIRSLSVAMALMRYLNNRMIPEMPRRKARRGAGFWFNLHYNVPWLVSNTIFVNLFHRNCPESLVDYEHYVYLSTLCVSAVITIVYTAR